jgi:hypothetical protein
VGGWVGGCVGVCGWGAGPRGGAAGERARSQAAAPGKRTTAEAACAALEPAGQVGCGARPRRLPLAHPPHTHHHAPPPRPPPPRLAAVHGRLHGAAGARDQGRAHRGDRGRDIQEALALGQGAVGGGRRRVCGACTQCVRVGGCLCACACRLCLCVCTRMRRPPLSAGRWLAPSKASPSQSVLPIHPAPPPPHPTTPRRR